MPENKPNNDNITKAFEPDYLNRKALAVEWTDALLSTKINHHLVISVSGDWGTGKTYLAKNWHKYLEEQKYFTCYIDAHKKDYAEDPLLIIMSEIESSVNKYTKKEEVFIKRAFTPVKKKFIPFLASGIKTAGKVGVSVLLPDVVSSVAKQIIDEVDAETVKEFVKSSIEKYGKKKDNYIKQYYQNIQAYSKNMEAFKQELEKFAAKFDKPVVIFIDELDRSNPKFVIKLIEQLKHIFEIPNLAFILTVNKKELSNTIKGIYGSEMDGYAYYKKFITHDFTLYPIEKLNDENLKIFIEETMKKYNYFKMSNYFISIAVTIVKSLDLSLRDIEQILDHLYYIREKVIQEYNKEYLIICFFYRAVYIKDYNVFISMREKLEYAPDELRNRNEYDKSFGYIYDKLISLCSQFTKANKFYGFLSNIINTIKDEEIKEIVHGYYSAKDFQVTYPDIIEYHYRMEFIGIPMVCKGIDNSNRPIFYNTVYEVRENILSIRKNLIQLSMLGAVPKDNIRK